MSQDAIMGTFVTVKTMADGTPRLTLDLQCKLEEVAAMGLIPGVPFAVARLTKEAANRPGIQQSGRHDQARMDAGIAENSEQKTASSSTVNRPGQLCVMAVNFCKDRLFWKWIERIHNLDCEGEDQAKEFILSECFVSSRKHLDLSAGAADDFHNRIRKPFLAWRDAQ